MFWYFGCEKCGIFARWLEIKPAPPVLEGGVLTPGPPVTYYFLNLIFQPQDPFWRCIVSFK